MDIQIILNQMAVLFILLAIGFIIGKLKVLTSEGNRVLTRIVLYVALPCTILNSVIGNDSGLTFGDTLFYLLICTLSFVLAFAISIPIIHLTNKDKNNNGLLTFMSVFSNCGFMGFPVTLAIFGVASGLYTAIYNIPFNLLSFSVGVLLIIGNKKANDSQQIKKTFKFKSLINPPLIASLLAIPISLIEVNPPFIITESIRITGSVTTPGAMIVVGCTLSNIPVKSVLTNGMVFLTSLLKLAIIPIITWYIFKFFISNEIMLGVLVVLSAMPTAAQSAMLAIEYEGNEQIASAGVFVSTLLCILTVPLLMILVL